MSADTDGSQRLKELIARIEVEQDPRAFSGLVDELNRLLDSGKSVQSERATAPEPTAAHQKNTSAMQGGVC